MRSLVPTLAALSLLGHRGAWADPAVRVPLGARAIAWPSHPWADIDQAILRAATLKV